MRRDASGVKYTLPFLQMTQRLELYADALAAAIAPDYEPDVTVDKA